MAGVRLATGYIEISAETSKVPNQIKDALSQAGQAAAKPAGQQMGKDIMAGINDGLKAAPAPTGSSGSILSDVIQGKPIGGQVREQGKKVGKEVATGINQGIQQGDAGGKKIDDVILAQTKPKDTGVKIGKDIGTGINEGIQQPSGKKVDEIIVTQAKPKETGKTIGTQAKEGINEGLEDAGKGPIQIIKEATKEFGKELVEDVRKGDVKEAFSRVGDVVANTTTGIANLGSVVGLQLDDVSKLGTDVATTLDKVGGVVEPVVQKIQTGFGHVRDITDNIKTIGSGDTLGKIKGIADSADALAKLGGLDISGVTKPITDIAGAAGSVQELAGAFTELGGVASAGGLTALGGQLTALAGPLSAIVAITGGAMYSIGKLGDVVNRGIPDVIRQNPDYFPGQDLFPTQPVSKTQAAEDLGSLLGVPAGQAMGPQRFRPGEVEPGWGVMGAPIGAAPVRPPTTTGQQAVFPPTITGTTGVAGAAAATPTTAGAATISAAQSITTASTATVNAGAVSVGGAVVSAPTVSTSPITSSSSAVQGPLLSSGTGLSAGGYKGTYGRGFQTGGPIDEDQLAKLHAGEHVLTAEDVAALGGQDQVANMRGALQGGANPGGGQGGAPGRTSGFVPVGAGSKSVAGTSFVAGLLNLGNEAISGLIDTGAQAATAAAAIGGFGAGGAAAGPAIQLGAGEAKRAVSYGFQMASIGADALIEQLFGMFGGPPRWLGYDYSQFVPNQAISQIGTTTVEKAIQGMKGGGGPGQQPGGPVTPEHLPGEQPVGPPVPKFGQAPPPQSLGGGIGQPGGAPGAPVDQQGIQAGLAEGMAGGMGGMGAAPPPPPPTASAAPGAGGISGGNPLDQIFAGLFDDGGVMPDNSIGINTSGRPELVLSPQQMDALGPVLGGRNPYGRGGDTYHITAVDANDVAKEIDKRKRLAMMQYAGRP